MGFARRPLVISWTPAIEGGGAFVEIGAIDDPALERPLDSRAVEGASVSVSDLPPGAYRVRVSSMDERDIIGLGRIRRARQSSRRDLFPVLSPLVLQHGRARRAAPAAE